MQNATTVGKALLAIGAALTLFNLIVILLTFWVGTAFFEMLKISMWLLAVYAIVGTLAALTLSNRNKKYKLTESKP